MHKISIERKEKYGYMKNQMDNNVHLAFYCKYRIALNSVFIRNSSIGICGEDDNQWQK